MFLRIAALRERDKPLKFTVTTKQDGQHPRPTPDLRQVQLICGVASPDLPLVLLRGVGRRGRVHNAQMSGGPAVPVRLNLPSKRV